MFRTDHQALTSLLTSKGTGRAGLRIARWSARLLCFTYDVTYRLGRLNVTAVCLFRLPLPSTGEASEMPDMVTALYHESLHAVSLSEFITACDMCSELMQLRRQIRTGWPRRRKDMIPELAPYLLVRDKLAVEDSLIMRGTDRMVIPVSLISRVRDLAYEGHQGLVRIKQRLRELY